MFQIWNSSLKIGILGQPDNLNNKEEYRRGKDIS